MHGATIKNRNTYTALLQCIGCKSKRVSPQGVSGRICHTSKNVSQFNLHLYNQTYLYPNLKRYGDSDTSRMWSACGSVYCARISLRRWVLEAIAKPSHTEENVLRKVLGNLRIIFKEVL